MVSPSQPWLSTAKSAASQAAGHEVPAFDLGNLPIHQAFCIDGIYTVETKDAADLAQYLDRNDQVFSVANTRRLDDLPPEIRRQVEIIATTRAGRRDVALIANRRPEPN